ncbi:trehalose-phosphatase [Acinetobacter indicus]|uniref:trehalose-phosphatase n=1 Tax=Acinetobacter indicus TaxID=756892 RepID=UPI0012E0EC23|nr:trehalose-phosphatase [Acinetobacter indicus]
MHTPQHIIEICQQQQRQLSLFLDLDGTLADFQLDPQHSFIPISTLNTLAELLQLGIPVSVVTGRSIEMARQLLQQLPLPIAELHGLQIWWNSTKKLQLDLSHINYKQLRADLSQACSAYPNLRIEDKQFSVALHYREYPDLAPVAQQIMAVLQARYPQLKLKQGKCVVELLPQQASKGFAISRLLEAMPENSTFPIFIGDDVTDEDGFAVVNQHQGLSIKVGEGETLACYRLANTQAVAELLHLIKIHCETGAMTIKRGCEGKNVKANRVIQSGQFTES